MPTILRIRGYRFFFYPQDRAEPPHVHVSKAGAEAKFWLGTLALARNHMFRAHDLQEIARILQQHNESLMEQWHDYFRGNQGR